MSFMTGKSFTTATFRNSKEELKVYAFGASAFYYRLQWFGNDF